MSSIKTPKTRFSSPLFLALLPWPAVAAGLFVFHSALLAFLFYATVCLFGTWQLGGFSCLLKPQWPLRVHLGIALTSNLLLVGLYQLLGKWLLPAELLNERLAGIGVTSASFAWLFPYFLIGNPLVEELFWRGSLAKRGSDRIGRRIVLAAMIAASTLSFASFYTWATGPWLVLFWTAGLFAYLAADILIAGLAAELFPTSHRSLASALRLFCWLAAGGIGLLVEAELYERWGSHGTSIAILSLLTPLSLLAIWFLPETAKKSLEEISAKHP